MGVITGRFLIASEICRGRLGGGGGGRNGNQHSHFLGGFIFGILHYISNTYVSRKKVIIIY